MPKSSCRTVSLIVALTAALAAGCGPRSEAEQLADARARIDRGQNDEARIQLKSLLQEKPTSAEGRFLLGKIDLEAGDAAGAENGLRRALDAGHPREAVVPPLAAAMLAQGKVQPLLQEFGSVDLSDPKLDAQLKTTLARAQIVQRDYAAATALAERAVKAAPDDERAALVRAEVDALRGDSAAASARVQALLAAKPNLAAAWAIKGDLLNTATPPDRSGAMAAWRKAVEIDPKHLGAHHALMQALLASNDLEGSKTQLEALKKVAPRHPMTMFLDALLAEQRGDLQQAREITQLLLRAAPDNPRLLLLAGQVESRLGSYSQAERHFSKALALAPQAAQIKWMLADAQMRSGNADRALETLKPVVDAPGADPRALALAAQALQAKGRASEAQAYLARAAKLRPDDSRLKTALAVSQIASGDEAQGLDALAQIASSDKGIAADLALIEARMRRRDLDGALKAIDALAAKDPKDPVSDYLRGRVAQQRGDMDGARKHHEAALAKNPDYMPSLASLATADMAQDKVADARARFEGLVKRQPKNVRAMLALAEIERRDNKPADALKWLDAAVKAEPSNPLPRVVLVEHHLRARDNKLALDTAQSAVAALPDNTDVLSRLGRAQLAAGDAQQAVKTYTKITQLEPTSAAAQLRLADAQATAKSPDAAAAAVRRAVELAPQQPSVQQAAWLLAMREKRWDGAVAAARKIQQLVPDDGLGWVLEGDAASLQGRNDAAQAAYRGAIARPRPNAGALRLHASLVQSKKEADAAKFAADWQRSHPDDIAFATYLGDVAIAGGRPAEAETLYREVLARQPRNPVVLNNLAHALAQQRKTGAVGFAEQALAITPDNPSMLDTLALALAADKQIKRAIEVQSKAVAKAPEAPQYRLQLARLHLEAGDKLSARGELRTLERLGSGFAQQDEVKRLMASTD